MPKYVYFLSPCFSFLRREFFISESKSKGVLAKLWIEVSGDWTAFWYKYITCYLKTKQRHPAVLWSSLSLTARQQKSLCFLDSANLEDISWKELSKCPATPPDSQVEGFVARIQNLRGSAVGQAMVVSLLGVSLCGKRPPIHCGSVVELAQTLWGGKVLQLLWGSSQYDRRVTWEVI